MKTKRTEGNSLPSPVLREVSQPESGAFWLRALYERNHTRTGMLRLLKL